MGGRTWEQEEGREGVAAQTLGSILLLASGALKVIFNSALMYS